jgi:hypothetical protein
MNGRVLWILSLDTAVSDRRRRTSLISGLELVRISMTVLTADVNYKEPRPDLGDGSVRKTEYRGE